MATAGDEATALLVDDRWSAFQDPSKKFNSGMCEEVDTGPDFSECVEKVLEQRWSQEEQDRLHSVGATSLYPRK